MINRSGIEVAMDAEASHPDALVAEALEPDSGIVSPGRPGRGKCLRDDCATEDQITRRTRAVSFQVRDVKTHIEVLGHVPLRARANPPAGPVVVAARLRKGESAISGARAFQRAEHIIGLRVVPYARPATIQ